MLYRFWDITCTYIKKREIFIAHLYYSITLIGRRPFKTYYKKMNLKRTFKVIYFFTSAHESLNVYVRICIIFKNFSGCSFKRNKIVKLSILKNVGFLYLQCYIAALYSAYQKSRNNQLS